MINVRFTHPQFLYGVENKSKVHIQVGGGRHWDICPWPRANFKIREVWRQKLVHDQKKKRS